MVTFDNLLILLVGLASLFSQLLVTEDAEVSDGAASLALPDHLLQHLCNKTIIINAHTS